MNEYNIKDKCLEEDDLTMQFRVFGTLPPVRTLKLTGSKCDILEWLESPRNNEEDIKK